MITHALILSLKITGIYMMFQQGMIFGGFRIIVANAFDIFFDKKWSKYLQKPLWDCLVCMSSVWTIVLTINETKTFGQLTGLILLVCGINVVIQKIISYEGDIGG